MQRCHEVDSHTAKGTLVLNMHGLLFEVQAIQYSTSEILARTQFVYTNHRQPAQIWNTKGPYHVIRREPANY
jgi:hypothetical protein